MLNLPWEAQNNYSVHMCGCVDSGSDYLDKAGRYIIQGNTASSSNQDRVMVQFTTHGTQLKNQENNSQAIGHLPTKECFPEVENKASPGSREQMRREDVEALSSGS